MIKSTINWLAKRHVFSVLFVAILLCLTIVTHSPDSVSSMFDQIAVSMLTTWLTAISIYVLYHFERYIENICEDSEKLTTNYRALTDLYHKDNLVKSADGNGVCFPIIQIGDIVELQIDDEHIHIEDDLTNKYHLPRIIENHYSEILQSHNTSSIYNAVNIRVLDMNLSTDALTLKTGRTTYFDSLVTNRAVDWEWGGSSTRSIFEYGPRMTPLSDSLMSNHLGFNGFVISKDGKIAFVRRSRHVSVAKCTYGNSVNASLKTKTALENGVFKVDKFRESIMKEYSTELHIEEKDISALKMIAVYRDCVEAGKPQFLTVAYSNLSANDIDSRFRQRDIILNWARLLNTLLLKGAKNFKKEFDQYRTIKDGNSLVWIKESDLLGEGEPVEIRPDHVYAPVMWKKHIQDSSTSFMRLKMTPSASVCVLFLRQYLLQKRSSVTTGNP